MTPDKHLVVIGGMELVSCPDPFYRKGSGHETRMELVAPVVIGGMQLVALATW